MSGSELLRGCVVAGHGRRYVVEAADGTRIPCLTGGRSVSPVCGDEVKFETGADGGHIREVLPRRSLFSKTDHRGKAVPAVANLDQVFMVLAPIPVPELFLMDKYLASIEEI